MNRKALLFVTTVLAFCSLIYELLFAVAISISLGGTNTNYILAIGFFLFGMGVGSLLQPKRFGKKKLLIFASIEILLCVVFLSGFYLILLSPFAFDFFSISEYYWPVRVLSALFCLLVGLLSGTEIPFLLDLAESKDAGKIIAFDYWGSFLASLLFSIWLIPHLGVILVAHLVPLLNLIAVTVLLITKWERTPFFLKLVLTLAFLGIALLIFKTSGIEDHLSSLF